MNNKYILRFWYAVAFLISLGLIIFYGRLTLPSLIIGTMEGDPLVIRNAIILIIEIVIITLIGGLNLYFYRHLYGEHRNSDNPWVKFIYAILVIGTFTAMSLFSLQVLGLSR